MEILAVTTGHVILASVAGLVAGGAVIFAALKLSQKAKLSNAEQELQLKIDEANRQAESIVKAAKLDAAEEVIKKKEELTAEMNQVQAQLRDKDNRLTKREDTLDRETEQLRKQENQLKESEKELQRKESNLEAKNKELSSMLAQQKNQLLKISGMNVEEARDLLLKRLEDECEHEMSQLIERKVEEAQEDVEQKSREIISTAIQRYAAEQTCEVTVSMVDIPSDEMKGRVIGREGRNIRAFEKATGVDVIVDDTPGVIIVSGFNPLRREVARQSMAKLIQDGRIHPTRIEEVVEQTQKELNQKVLQLGKAAATEVDVRGLPNKLLAMLGSLNYRTSYGQNVLRHSVEVAFLAQVMAEELGLDGSIARRAGLLHDIGKAMDRETEGGHPAIGTNYLKRFNESSVILNAVEAHHGDIPANNPYTPLIAAADAVSASRPGARRETLERYIKRLEKLEEIGNSFQGVENCYAIQAGREVRVIVDSNKIIDDNAMKMARDIAKKIEDEMTYPGEIKVTLLREVRCVEYAR
ncbi:Ribonuclease Y [Anaerohalosphaera lusitana]|uniref:Ribonuclease Y n=1 Tax=Anaerohalosphaera lusitana TaxID=1936003 RepID=A0A1U9NPH1_9BACT|nr:ribonuclease Y [Anaerohalosphaera lusitana]AQT69735.1 Ribonuclease Y [Anaerohalosphaera lusitana]